MTCTRYPDDDLVMRYVTGDLAEPDQSTFEDHLFDCDTCLARVERYQAAQQVLAARELPSMPTVVAMPTITRPPRRSAWWWLAAAAAVLVVVAAGLLQVRQRPAPVPQQAEQQSAPVPEAPVTDAPDGPATGEGSTPAAARSLQFAVLAMVTPPPYVALTTRGETPAVRFATGMEAYNRHDWAAAADALRDVDTPAARFYQGIADLMRGESADAASSLEAVRTSGVSPYARESAFYLGKAALQRSDVAAARAWFTTARQEGATTAKEAARLLTALDDLQTQ